MAKVIECKEENLSIERAKLNAHKKNNPGEIYFIDVVADVYGMILEKGVSDTYKDFIETKDCSILSKKAKENNVSIQEFNNEVMHYLNRDLPKEGIPNTICFAAFGKANSIYQNELSAKKFANSKEAKDWTLILK